MDVEEFNRKAKEIFENEVIPQIKNAMKKQTAVEWLRQELLKRDMDISIKEIFEQAKEMEKEQIKNAYVYGIQDEYVIGAEQYYNETFKSE